MWFSPVSSTNKTDHHDITEILLKVALNTINQTKPFGHCIVCPSNYSFSLTLPLWYLQTIVGPILK
jgi:hypothetical protein